MDTVPIFYFVHVNAMKEAITVYHSNTSKLKLSIVFSHTDDVLLHINYLFMTDFSSINFNCRWPQTSILNIQHCIVSIKHFSQMVLFISCCFPFIEYDRNDIFLLHELLIRPFRFDTYSMCLSMTYLGLQ